MPKGGALLCILLSGCGVDANLSPPETPRIQHAEVMHGFPMSDPCHWLEDMESPQTRSWLAAENAYSSSHFERLGGRELVRQRLRELMRIDQTNAPYERGGRYFSSKRRAKEDLWSVYYREGIDSEDKLLIDPSALSDDKTVSVHLFGVSHDGELAAYGVRGSGQDEVRIRILDVNSGKEIAESLPKGLYGSVSFTEDKRAFFYSLRDREAGARIYRHEIGTDSSKDRVVFGEGYGPDVFLSASVADQGDYLLITAQHGWARNEIWIQKLPGNQPPRAIVRDVEALFRPVWASPRQLAVQTGWEAPNRRILMIDVEKPSRDEWREVVPEGEDAIQSFSVIAGKLFVNYLHNVAAKIRVFTLEGKPEDEVKLPENSSGWISGRWNSDEAFMGYSSFSNPGKTYRYDATTRERQEWFAPRAPVDAADFETKQVWYASKDGTRVPMFLVHKKGFKPDGNAPVLLTGYGGFNVSMTPGFRPIAVLWAEMGGVFALPNLRGGGEFGDAWHRGGMLANKQNVFDDFIAAAEWLVDNEYTRPERLAIRGVSNGGLLMGAALTQRPDLFRAVVCAYPDLDMVRYWRYKENNNPPALLEYGDGSKPEHFEFLRAYSPYERVEEGVEYPAVLLTTGEGDTRVPPQQALKMTAKLRWATRSGQPILLRFDAKGGHAGGRPFSAVVDDSATEQAFLLSRVGVDLQ